MHVTALTASDAQQYRDLMLEAYVQAADAFTSTAKERQVEPMSWWVKRIAAPSGLSQSFGAFQEERLVGTVTLEFSAKPKTRHSALVIGMYVRPHVRGLGAGALLMQAAIAAAAARPELRLLRLTLTEGNEPAKRLYESVGFLPWGVEPQAIRTPAGWCTCPCISYLPNLRPNPSFKPSPNGVSRGPGRRYTVHFRQPGPRATPLVPA